MDRSYRSGDPEEDAERARKIYQKFKLTWPNVFVPKGWDEVTSTFNAQGYGLILVDPKGVVRGANVREREIEGLLGKIYPGVQAK